MCARVACSKFINKLAINIRRFADIVIDIRDEIMHILMDLTPSTTKQSGGAHCQDRVRLSHLLVQNY